MRFEGTMLPVPCSGCGGERWMHRDEGLYVNRLASCGPQCPPRLAPVPVEVRELAERERAA